MNTTHAHLYFNDFQRWRRDQEALLARGAPLALEDHWEWIRDVSGRKHWFGVAPGAEDDGVAAAAAAQRLATWSFPGHYRLRVTRFGHGLQPEHAATLAEGFRELVDADGRLLSVNLELFSPDATHRARLEDAVRREGYERVPGERRYRWTARLDLSPPEEELMAGFTRSCRRAIREPAKHGYRVETLTDSRWAPRMDALWRETFARTGARAPACDWVRRVEFARRNPHLYTIIGAFNRAYPERDSLVAFACAMNNVDHAVYSEGASTREEDSRLPLSYTPVWGLMRWARARGCAWFDMGGISVQGSDPRQEDPREGISDFKLRFTDDVVEVGSEWAYRPPTFRSRLAERLRVSGTRLRAVFDRR